MLPYWHTGVPDGDNILKAVQDALTGVAWRDDSQVCQATVCKVVCGGSNAPGVDILVSLLCDYDLGAFPLAERS